MWKRCSDGALCIFTFTFTSSLACLHTDDQLCLVVYVDVQELQLSYNKVAFVLLTINFPCSTAAPPSSSMHTMNIHQLTEPTCVSGSSGKPVPSWCLWHKFQKRSTACTHKIDVNVKEIYKPYPSWGVLMLALIRESVDSLCRDGADAQYMQYLSKSGITSSQTCLRLISAPRLSLWVHLWSARMI